MSWQTDHKVELLGLLLASGGYHRTSLGSSFAVFKISFEISPFLGVLPFGQFVLLGLVETLRSAVLPDRTAVEEMKEEAHQVFQGFFSKKGWIAYHSRANHLNNSKKLCVH